MMITENRQLNNKIQKNDNFKRNTKSNKKFSPQTINEKNSGK